MPEFFLHPLTKNEQEWVIQFTIEQWGADKVVAHGTVYYPHELPGFVAVSHGEKVGLITYHIEEDNCEIVTVNATRPYLGVGTALIEVVRQVAHQAGCRRLWLITTNDNINALRFYQKRGFALVAIHRNAVEKARQLKPEIPPIGDYGIPLRDEIELELLLAHAAV